MAPFENDAPPADEEPRWGSRRQFGDTATASLVFAFGASSSKAARNTTHFRDCRMLFW